MSERLHVATRKGLFVFERGAGGAWKLARTAFLGEPVTIVLEDPRDGRLHAALRLGHFGCKMHVSEDRGATWRETAVPAYPEATDASLDQVWALEHGGEDRPGRLWAGTLPGGLFRSDDDGASWELVRSLWDEPARAEWFGGGYDHPGIHSICVDPRDSDRLSVAVSCGGVWHSGDAGATWENESRGMIAEYMPPERREDPKIQDPHRMVRCPSAPDRLWVQHHNGVFRSDDGARSWSVIPDVPPSVFGFAVAVHPEQPDVAWFVPAVKDECRIPVDGRVSVARTRDGGATFESLANGLPQDHAYDLVFRHALDVDDAGETLAMGSTTGNLWIGARGGESWSALSMHLPPIYQVRFA